ncbi:Chromosome transmission fidelity protein 8-like protein [Frankliniella fusca]|uniref:Chromosome transmission fidelity protein 8-like protein n=1 Tax=Frankliniella fusca TaxID=407009 RepID=A0AAE1LDL2_9NEOP|nr:Chromosome transmission fidelity protein 8-like protein [Frankliniella fusca]
MILIKLPDEGKEVQWGIVELQGDLISQSGEDTHGQFIGDLHYTKQGTPILIIGHHILTGKEVVLEKPFAVLERKRGVQPDCCKLENSAVTEFNTEYQIRAVIKKKLLFKVRPKPIISNVLKSV